MFQSLVAHKGGIEAVQGIEEAGQYFLELGYDRGEIGYRPTATQVSGVVRNNLGAQDAFAFGIDLQREVAKVHFEHRQVIRRFLDRNC